MPLEQRAKIFIPFEPLKGMREAMRQKELELEQGHPDMHPLGRTATSKGRETNATDQEATEQPNAYQKQD